MGAHWACDPTVLRRVPPEQGAIDAILLAPVTGKVSLSGNSDLRRCHVPGEREA